MEEIKRRPPWTISDVMVIDSRGPWTTKSGGELNVMFALSSPEVQNRYLNYDSSELKRIPSDIRGLRAYTVRDLPKNKIGGMEWHRVREEMVFSLNGRIHWECEDLLGDKKEFMLDDKTGIWMPPFILHTYKILDEGSRFLVIANTLFDPDDERTHDTYPMDLFRKEQANYTL